MTGIEVDIEGRAGAFEIKAVFNAGAGVTALFGPSGAGKSTILKMIAGTARPSHGRIVAAGRVLYDSMRDIDQPPEKRGIGFVFQDDRLFPHMTVARNLTYARWAGRRSSARSFDEVVTLLGLHERLAHMPATLSGGERQRVAIGRALLSDPALLLMDEPLSSLDMERRSEILPYLEAIRDETRIPILYVSHETTEVARLAGTVVMVENGRVTETGSTARVLGHIGFEMGGKAVDASALIEGRIIDTDPGYQTATVAVNGGQIELTGANLMRGTTVRLRVRAADVAIATAPHAGLSIRNQLACTVEEMRREGAFTLVAMALGKQRLLARITAKSADALKLAPGIRVIALLKAVSVEAATVPARRSTNGGVHLAPDNR